MPGATKSAGITEPCARGLKILSLDQIVREEEMLLLLFVYVGVHVYRQQSFVPSALPPQRYLLLNQRRQTLSGL